MKFLFNLLQLKELISSLFKFQYISKIITSNVFSYNNSDSMDERSLEIVEFCSLKRLFVYSDTISGSRDIAV